MRIVHVAYYFFPAVGYQEAFLVREQSRLGHHVDVVTSDRYAPLVYHHYKEVLGRRIKGVGFFVEEGINVWRLKTLFELPNAIWVLGLESKIQELQPDVVVVHGMANFSAIRIARLKSRTNSFSLIYDDHMQSQASRSIARIPYALFKCLFSPSIQDAADALVAILPETKVFMHERYGIPNERITIIPLGADTELFHPDDVVRREKRLEFGFSEDNVVFIYTGKIIPEKKLHLLIDATANLVAEQSNVRLMLVGSGDDSYIRELKQHAAHKNTRDAFVWHEAVPNKELPGYYCAADAAVWPCGPSISMREAMACELPLVISERSGVTELVAYGNGFAYQEGDVDQLAGHMAKLLDPQMRRDMGMKSRELVVDRFSWRSIAAQFIDVA